ncbi:MAG: AAA family ATPase, partial [Solirubrobacteraceae bacterium]
MRPRTLGELVGQEHLLGTPGEPTALRRAIAEGRPHSMLLHGPPGSGKTTLARLVAGAADAAF